jgi:Polymorphic toxin system, DSP-PTPase phosphatase
MLEPEGRTSVTATMPAIGPGGPLPPRIRRRRFAAAFVLLLLLGVAKSEIPRAAAEAYFEAGPGRLVVPGLVVGAAPSDGELQQLADSAQVGGVVNLGAPSVAEQVTAAALHLAYLRLPVPLGGAPTWRQLRVLALFMRIHTTKGDSVYLHDDRGDGRAATAAAMLLMLRGESRYGTVAGVGSTSFGAAQRLAIRQLGSTLRPGHGPLPGSPYSAARRVSW